LAKYRTLEKIGKIEIGMKLFRKLPIGTIEGPWVVNSLYLQRGSGAIVVQEAPLDSTFAPGSRMLYKNAGVTKAMQILDVKPADWFIKIEG